MAFEPNWVKYHFFIHSSKTLSPQPQRAQWPKYDKGHGRQRIGTNIRRFVFNQPITSSKDLRVTPIIFGHFFHQIPTSRTTNRTYHYLCIKIPTNRHPRKRNPSWVVCRFGPPPIGLHHHPHFHRLERNLLVVYEAIECAVFVGHVSNRTNQTWDAWL